MGDRAEKRAGKNHVKLQDVLLPAWERGQRLGMSLSFLIPYLINVPYSTGFRGGSPGKEATCNVTELGSIPGLGRVPGEGKGYHSSLLAWRMPWTTVHGVAESQTRLSSFHIPFTMYNNLKKSTGFTKF